MAFLIRIAVAVALGMVPAYSQSLVYFGTYAGKGSEGIYLSELDDSSGQLGEPRLAYAADGPEFMAIHPSGAYLYCISRSESGSSQISALKILDDGSLELLNQRETGGRGSCHVSLDQTGKVAMVAHYSSGDVVSYPVNSDGTLGELASRFQHHGSSVNPDRQTSSHAHSVNADPLNAHVFVADLGIDQVRIYDLDTSSGALAVNEPAFASSPAGSGPRHMDFHPTGEFAYANLELTSEVQVFRYDSRQGSLDSIQVISSLPVMDEPVRNSTAEIRVHPSGRFLYVSNRGHNSIAGYRISDSTGELSFIVAESTRGERPRNFNLDPSGRYLIAANQDTNNVAVFRVDEETGQLEWTGSEINVPTPVCVRFVIK